MEKNKGGPKPKPKVHKACKECRQLFVVTKFRKTYCSRACYFESKRHRTDTTFVCAVCSKTFHESHSQRQNLCCSAACRGIYQRRRVTLSCGECGVDYEVKLHVATAGSKFCSQSCRAKFNIRLHPRFHSNPDRSSRPKPYEKPGYLKLASKVRARDGYKCVKCGKEFVKGGGRLEVHHKIPIRNGGTDDMDNLESLCVRCHRQSDIALRRVDGLALSGRAKGLPKPRGIKGIAKSP